MRISPVFDVKVCFHQDRYRIGYRYGRDPMRLDQAKDRSSQILETQNTVFRCNWKLAREKGLQFYKTRSHAVVLYNTLSAARIEKAVCMKNQDELHQKVRLTPRKSRVVLKSNSQYGLQDPQSQEERSPWEPSSDSKSYREICNNTVDQRISGVPLSAVEQQNTKRKNKVKRLIEKFENCKYKESFLQDLSQTQKINKFSKESQDVIADLNDFEIFELGENSSKQQCPDCNAYWENRYNLLQLWRKYEILAESERVRPEQPDVPQSPDM